MSSRTTTPILLLLSLTLTAGGALAQETSQPAPAKPEAPKAESSTADAGVNRPPSRQDSGPMLRVQLVISRYQGERKTGSLPYSMTVTPSGDPTRLRMGVDTPVPTSAVRPKGKAEDDAPAVPPGFQYRSVGTNIDCRAREVAGRKYRLSLRVENSSGAMSDASKSGEPTLAGIPMFRRFEVTTEPLLGDGESVQVIASTDPVTGEVVKIDVTLTVLK